MRVGAFELFERVDDLAGIAGNAIVVSIILTSLVTALASTRLRLRALAPAFVVLLSGFVAYAADTIARLLG